MARPERIYDWIANANISVPEVLLVPLLVNGKTPVGTLWVVAKDDQHFDASHARVLSELAVFSGIALQMIQGDHELKQSLDAQETLTKEMSHRVKNVFAITDGMIRMTARNSTTKEELAESLLGRLHALSDAHSLVRRSFDPSSETKGVALTDVIDTVLRPYRKHLTQSVPMHLGERSTNAVALVCHELATNAAKYGALTSESGVVNVDWTTDGDNLVLTWRETGGAAIAAPGKKGFGTTLVASTISGHDGTIDYDWNPAGLIVRIVIPLARLAH